MSIPKEPIEKVNKFPLAYALMILGGLVGIFANKMFDSSANEIKGLKEQNTALIKQLSEKETNILYWQNRYLNQVEYSVNQQRKQDSLNRAILQQPNREFTKAIKHRTNE